MQKEVMAAIGYALALFGMAALLSFANGCSLEAARQARLNTARGAAPVTARPAAECRRLDDVHVYTAYGAEFSLGVGVGAGALVAADTSQKVEDIAIGTGIGAATAAAVLGSWSQKSAAQWAKECSQ